MSRFASSSPSTSGPLLSLACRGPLPFLYPLESLQSPRPFYAPFDRHTSSLAESARFDAWLFKSFAPFNQCHQRRPCRPRRSLAPNATPLCISRFATEARVAFNICYKRHHYMESTSRKAEYADEPIRTKEELLAFVDQYRECPYTEPLPYPEPSNLKHKDDGAHFTVSDKLEDEGALPKCTQPSNTEEIEELKKLRRALMGSDMDSEAIFQLYRQLPSPRAPYLSNWVRHRLLRCLAVQERKNEESMLRYFSVMDDMKLSSIPLSQAEWTSALSFAARSVARSTEVDVEAALIIWREMEHTAGVRADSAAFNVLFDVSCKAGKFVLAEMIYKEMIARGLKFSRYHHVSLIHFNGLRGDGNGVRAAYKALIEAGEIVDTVVLNAVISSLIYACEAQAAENVYERMKQAHFSRLGSRLQPKDYKTRRNINAILKSVARAADESKRAALQKHSIIAPDAQTFRILVNNAAVTAGDLQKTAKYLDEMMLFDLPLYGAIFFALFKGFAMHGGIRYTEWTEKRLESVLSAFMQAVKNEVEGLYVSKWMVTWALRAFAKCSGKARMLSVWVEIKELWKPNDLDLDFVMNTLRTLLQGINMAEQRNDWLLGTR